MDRVAPTLLLALALLAGAVPLAAQGSLPPGYDAAAADADWAAVLSRYVRDGAVSYGRMQSEDPVEWRRYLAWLSAARPDAWPVNDRRAFWINAYNARTIAGVLARYPIGSVKDVGVLGGRFRGFFGRREHPVAGRSWTLDEIEDRVLRRAPLFDDRVHWALVCASRGCPRLRSEPYRGSDLDRQLDFQARTYLNGPAGHRLDPERKVLFLTRILDWYARDFRRSAASMREYAARYLTGAAAEAAEDPAWTVRWLEYDWRLNEP